MRTFDDLNALRAYINAIKRDKKTIGLVPTMGFLHEGHLSLMRAAKSSCDVVIVSVYVNPTQFGPNEDLDNYPRDEEGDRNLMFEVGVDACFFPTNEMMYPEGYATYIEPEGSLVDTLCGAKRPGHFRGVATIVSKLFNLIEPDKAFFGMKDAQQVAVIRRMVDDLNFKVEIVPCPIIREDDGLAMSSRNKYLQGESREQALALRLALDIAEAEIEAGNRESQSILEKMTKSIESYSLSKIDYISIVDFKTLREIDALKGEVLIAMAVYIDGTRLIDNVRVEVK